MLDVIFQRSLRRVQISHTVDNTTQYQNVFGSVLYIFKKKLKNTEPFTEAWVKYVPILYTEFEPA